MSKQLHVSATWTQLLLILCLPHHDGRSSLKPQVQIHTLSPELLGPVDKINNTHVDLVALPEQFSPVNWLGSTLLSVLFDAGPHASSRLGGDGAPFFPFGHPQHKSSSSGVYLFAASGWK